jgi:hypothetical protein
MSVPRNHPKYTPVNLIPEAQRTGLDVLALEQVNSIFEHVRATMDTARSKQIRIGVSEFGDDCRKCVARKLGEVDQIKDPNWKAQIGTFGHAGLEQHFLDTYPWMYDVEYRENADEPGGWERVITVKPDLVATDEQPLYHLERTVLVGTFGQPIRFLTGSCDLFIQGATFGIVVDWKFQGASTLKKSSTGRIGAKYHTQMNGYGLGYRNAGYHVTHVVLFALPRDDELEAARPVLMKFEPDMATAALERLTEMCAAAALIGWQAVIDAQPKASGCWDCKRFDEAEQRDFVSSL